MECSSKRRGCELEVRCTTDQMKAAFRQAEEYEPDKNPYGVPAYPYVWRAFPENMALRAEMGYRGPNRVVADFSFEFQQGRNGVAVHVSVWVVRPTWNLDPAVAGFAALPSKDTRLHQEAANHLNALLGRPTAAYTVVPPEMGEVPPPPPPTA